MNEFTKEELLDLLSCIGIVRAYTEIELYGEELFDKIRSMIDNYDAPKPEPECEHIFALMPHISYTDDEKLIYDMVNMCRKCGLKKPLEIKQEPLMRVTWE